MWDRPGFPRLLSILDGSCAELTADWANPSRRHRPLGCRGGILADRLRAGSRAIQLAAEARALTVPTPENARKWLKTITAEPHVAGTQADYKTAVFVRDRLQEWGWKADLVSYEVLLNYPIGKTSPTGKTSLQINRPMFKELGSMRHPCRPTRTPQAAMPSALSRLWDQWQSLGSGRLCQLRAPEDFTALEKLGIAVKDKIVLARYGGNFRGLKVLNAQKHGARGILILFRSGRRRLRQGRRLSRRAVPSGLGDPAKQRPVPLAPTGDPSTGAAIGRDCRPAPS